MKKSINRDGQDEQDKSKAQKANLKFQIQNLKSKIQNVFILFILSIPVNSFFHPCLWGAYDEGMRCDKMRSVRAKGPLVRWPDLV
jgi:hypothetical protein